MLNSLQSFRITPNAAPSLLDAPNSRIKFRLRRTALFDSTTTTQAKRHHWRDAFFLGAGKGNRTPIISLENWDNNHYTIPARIKFIFLSLVQLLSWASLFFAAVIERWGSKYINLTGLRELVYFAPRPELWSCNLLARSLVKPQYKLLSRQSRKYTKNCPSASSGHSTSEKDCKIWVLTMKTEWSGTRDSNPEPLGPKPSALANWASSRRNEMQLYLVGTSRHGRS